MSNILDALLIQACGTADTYMRAAIQCIDKCFGNGYAKDHPELVTAFMQVAALDFKTSKKKGGTT
jgi:hypothetical protein